MNIVFQLVGEKVPLSGIFMDFFPPLTFGLLFILWPPAAAAAAMEPGAFVTDEKCVCIELFLTISSVCLCVCVWIWLSCCVLPTGG